MSRTVYALLIMGAVYSAKSMSTEHCAVIGAVCVVTALVLTIIQLLKK